MKKSILAIKLEPKAKEGWSLFRLISGQIAPENPRSDLYHTLQDARISHPNHEVSYIVGSHKWSGADGFNMAVIIKKK